MILIKIFYVFFKVAVFSVGGAYSFLGLIECEVVEKLSWITRDEFLEVTGITQIFPGAISIKYATYIGYKMAGVPGVIVANLANFLPPAVFVVVASVFYKKYKNLVSVEKAFSMIRIAVFSMILVVAFQLIGIKYIVSFKHVLFACLFLLLFIFVKIHPAFILIGAGVIGFLIP